MFDKRRLNRMEAAASFEPFNRCDAFAILHGRERHAREHAPSIDVDRTGTTFAAIASFLGTCQAHSIAQSVEQRRSRLDSQLVARPVDVQSHRECRSDDL